MTCHDRFGGKNTEKKQPPIGDEKSNAFICRRRKRNVEHLKNVSVFLIPANAREHAPSQTGSTHVVFDDFLLRFRMAPEGHTKGCPKTCAQRAMTTKAKKKHRNATRSNDFFRYPNREKEAFWREPNHVTCVLFFRNKDFHPTLRNQFSIRKS